MTEQSNVTEAMLLAGLAEMHRHYGSAPPDRECVTAIYHAMTTAAPREAIVGQLENAVTLLVDELEPLPTTGTDSRAQAVSAGKAALEAARKQA